LSEITSDRLRLMDGIVGQCIRDLEFGRLVLDDPVTALAGFGLEQDEMDDFVALAKVPGVLDSWRVWHELFLSGGRAATDGRTIVDPSPRA
jgi:hypothetical protein